MSEDEGSVARETSDSRAHQSSHRLALAVLRVPIVLAVFAIASAVWALTLLPIAEAVFDEAPYAHAEPDAPLYPLLQDSRPVAIQVTEAWEKVPWVVPAEDLLRDPTLWNRLHFDDWDRVPEPLRDLGLERMAARYRRTASGPARWRTMQAADWDRVPQPVRAMAYLRMAEYWARHDHIGASHEVSARDAADTLGALIMVESWFEHRSTNVDILGSRDLGLPQASDYFRTRLEYFHRTGALDFALAEEDYFNPWLSIRAGGVWLDVMLDEASGDLDVAVRAYRKGIAAALRGEAQDYLENLRRKRARYIRNHDAPPAWDFLWRRLRGGGRTLGHSVVDARGRSKDGER